MSSFSVVPITHRFGRDHWDWPTRSFFDDDPFMRMEESLLTGSYPRYYIVDRSPQSSSRSSRELLTRQMSAVAPEVRTDSKNFHVLLDVAQFSPDEIEVKVSDNDNTVIITGKHEEKKDDKGFCSREFTRRYTLPADVDPASVTSTLNADGVLTLKAPRKLSASADKDRVIPLKVTHISAADKL